MTIFKHRQKFGVHLTDRARPSSDLLLDLGSIFGKDGPISCGVFHNGNKLLSAVPSENISSGFYGSTAKYSDKGDFGQKMLFYGEHEAECKLSGRGVEVSNTSGEVYTIGNFKNGSRTTGPAIVIDNKEGFCIVVEY
jgi:hypothetical protein